MSKYKFRILFVLVLPPILLLPWIGFSEWNLVRSTPPEHGESDESEDDSRTALALVDVSSTLSDTGFAAVNNDRNIMLFQLF